MKARISKIRQDLVCRAGIVICFVRFPIAQVRYGQLAAAGSEIMNPGKPQALDIKHMPGMLLRRPLARGFADELFSRAVPDQLLEPRSGSAQPNTQIGIQLQRKREFKFAIKPPGYLSHARLDELSCCFAADKRSPNIATADVPHRRLPGKLYVAAIQ